MRSKWVDNTDYIGPDRRRASPGLRWRERRRFDETTPEPPPLGAMLRRLRVQILGMQSAADRLHVMQLAAAAAKQAEVQRSFPCADIIREVSREVMRANLQDATIRASLDSRLIDALNIAAPR